MTDYRIRPATPADLERIVAIELAAARQFEGIIDGIVDMTADDVPADAYAEAIARGDVFVAEDGNGVAVAFAVMGLMDGEPYLAEIDTHPEHQKRGIGRLLIATCEDWAREQGKRSILLSTFRDVPWNGPYYARLGFAFVPTEECRTPQMLSQREREAASGLDMGRRTFMRKFL